MFAEKGLFLKVSRLSRFLSQTIHFISQYMYSLWFIPWDSMLIFSIPFFHIFGYQCICLLLLFVLLCQVWCFLHVSCIWFRCRFWFMSGDACLSLSLYSFFTLYSVWCQHRFSLEWHPFLSWQESGICASYMKSFTVFFSFVGGCNASV